MFISAAAKVPTVTYFRDPPSLPPSLPPQPASVIAHTLQPGVGLSHSPRNVLYDLHGTVYTAARNRCSPRPATISKHRPTRGNAFASCNPPRARDFGGRFPTSSNCTAISVYHPFMLMHECEKRATMAEEEEECTRNGNGTI